MSTTQHAGHDQGLPTPPSTSPTARRGVRSTTVVWGLLLMAGGVLVAALGFGYRLDAITFAVIVSATLGVALLLLAVLPRRRPRPTVMVYEPLAPSAPTATSGPAAPTRPEPATAAGPTEQLMTTPATPAAPTERLTGAGPDPSTAETELLPGDHDRGDWWDPRRQRD